MLLYQNVEQQLESGHKVQLFIEKSVFLQLHATIKNATVPFSKQDLKPSYFLESQFWTFTASFDYSWVSFYVTPDDGPT